MIFLCRLGRFAKPFLAGGKAKGVKTAADIGRFGRHLVTLPAN